MDRDEIITVSAAEFQRNVDLYQDKARTHPVAITKDGHEQTVLLSAEEYRRLKRRDRRVIETGDLAEAEIEAIKNARVPDEYAHLNDKLKDWQA